MKLLIISSRIPYPLNKGDKLRLYHQLEDFVRSFDVTLICLTDEIINKEEVEKQLPQPIKLVIHPLSKINIAINLMASVITKLPFQVAYFYDKSIQQKIKRWIDKEKPDHIYCQLIRTSEYIRNIPIAKTIDYMDCFSLNSQKRAETIRNFFMKFLWIWESKKVKKYEKEIAGSFDHCIVISRPDAAALSLTNKTVHVIPNGIDHRFFNMVGKERDIDLLFVGNLSYYSNIHSVHTILDEILPKLLIDNPSVVLVIAGANPSKELEYKIRATKNVKLLKNVDDISTVYKRAHVFVAPITKGTGQQNKILEALAAGCKVVCSQEVASGINTEFPKMYTCMHTHEYPPIIKKLLQEDPAQSHIPDHTKALLQKHHDWRALNGVLISILKNT